MGAFNTMVAPMRCPVCGVVGDFAIQFKYGETWQHTYRLGDDLIWGRRNTGEKGLGMFTVEGFAERCSACGSEGFDVDIVCQGDRLASVSVVSSGREESLKGYRVLKRQG